MSLERFAIDANVLVYALYADSERHIPCRRLIESAISSTANLCITSQVLAEVYSTVTSPKRVSVPRSPDEAVMALKAVLAMPGMSLLPLGPEVPFLWLNLVQRRPVKGGGIFDLQLAAAMISNGIRKLYTYNSSDFRGIDGVESIAPPEHG